MPDSMLKHGNNKLHDGLPSDELRVILSNAEKEMITT